MPHTIDRALRADFADVAMRLSTHYMVDADWGRATRWAAIAWSLTETDVSVANRDGPEKPNPSGGRE